MSKTKDQQSSGTPDPKAKPQDATDGELSADELEQVGGGIGLLLPAVQKVREAATQAMEPPMEEISLNYSKITSKK